ncbi:MAG: hypothetical protein U0559_17215 [Anaerolineae bacterium]
MGDVFPGTTIHTAVLLPDDRVVAVGTDGVDFIIARYFADGQIDSSFGINGVTRVDFSGKIDFANAVALTPAGKLLIAGTTRDSSPLSQTDFAIARLNPDGSPDNTFGAGGKVTVDFHGRQDVARWVIPYQDSVGPILVGGSAEANTGMCFPACDTNIALVRLNDDGSLYTTFGTGGKMEIDLGGSETSAAALQQPYYPGNVDLVGSRTASTSQYVIAQISGLGGLDHTFGSNGIVTGTTPVPLVNVTQVYTNGNYDLIGIGTTGNDMALLRVDHTGNLVSDFGTGGIVVQDFGGVDTASALSQLPDGTLLVAGNSDARLALARFTDRGQIISGGPVLTDLNDLGATSVCAFGLQYIRDVRLWTIGSLQAGATTRLVMTRHFTDLSADAGGRQTTDFSDPQIDPTAFSSEQAHAVAFQPDGKLLVAGQTLLWPSYAGAIARYNPNGALDSTFGVGGRLVITTTTGLIGVQVQLDKKIAIADDNFDVERLNPEGSPDLSFGESGWATANFAGAHSSALVLQNDGKLVVAGEHVDVSQLNTIALARFNTNGTLDPGFGVGGKLVTGLGLNAVGLDVAVQPDGKLLVAGVTFANESNYASHDFALVRYNPNGSLDTSFGSGGKVTTDFGAYEIAFAIVVQPDGKIVVGGASIPGALAFARYKPDGSLDATFGVEGKLSVPSLGQGRVNDLALDANRIVAAACDPVFDTGLVVRLTSTGALDSSFNGNGRAPFEFTGADCPQSIAVSKGRIAAAGYAAFSHDQQDFAVALYQRGAVPANLYLPLVSR